MGSFNTSGAPFFVTWFPCVNIGHLPNSDAIADWIQEIWNANDAYVRIGLDSLAGEDGDEDANFHTPELTQWVHDFRLAFPENQGYILVEVDF